MNNQMPLLTDTPIARTQDPATSHVAAAKVNKSGKRAVQQAIAFSYVRTWPGKTARELAHIYEYTNRSADGELFHKRLPEIACDHDKFGRAKTPLVKKRGTKICSVTGHTAACWVPFDYPNEL